MSVQTKINKRPFYNAAGEAIGATGALGRGVPGTRADAHFIAAHAATLTADSKYGYWFDDGLVVNPTEGVRYGGGTADSLAIKSGTPVTIATKGHWFVAVNVGSAPAALAKGAKLYKTAAGEITTASSGNTEAPLKVLEAVAYDNSTKKGAEQFSTDGSNYFVVVPVEL